MSTDSKWDEYLQKVGAYASIFGVIGISLDSLIKLIPARLIEAAAFIISVLDISAIVFLVAVRPLLALLLSASWLVPFFIRFIARIVVNGRRLAREALQYLVPIGHLSQRRVLVAGCAMVAIYFAETSPVSQEFISAWSALGELAWAGPLPHVLDDRPPPPILNSPSPQKDREPGARASSDAAAFPKGAPPVLYPYLEGNFFGALVVADNKATAGNDSRPSSQASLGATPSRSRAIAAADFEVVADLPSKNTPTAQFYSVLTQADARRLATPLKGRLGDSLGQQNLFIRRVSLVGKGGEHKDYYRVLGGPFSSEDEVSRFCDAYNKTYKPLPADKCFMESLSPTIESAPDVNEGIITSVHGLYSSSSSRTGLHGPGYSTMGFYGFDSPMNGLYHFGYPMGGYYFNVPYPHTSMSALGLPIR